MNNQSKVVHRERNLKERGSYNPIQNNSPPKSIIQKTPLQKSPKEFNRMYIARIHVERKSHHQVEL